MTFFDQELSGHGWRTLAIFPKGLRWRRSGCGAYWHAVRRPMDLAEEISPEILKAAWATIENGTVWECVQESLE